MVAERVGLIRNSSKKKTNELNDKQEIRDLSENIKQTLYQEYKTAYSE
jgi:hypothetical protein